MTVKTTRTLVALAVVLGLAMLPATAVAQGSYSPVTDQRLVKPEPENWLQIRGNYQGWGYSPLGQITANNVKKLTPVWAFSTGVGSGHEAPPIVNNGVMFVATPYSQVIALEAKTGKLIWRYKRELPEDFKALHNTSRGIALFGDKVYVASLDCSLVALDAKTGKVAWEKKVEDYHTGYYMTLAPLVAKGKVMVGVSGGEFGVRGFVQAFDARSGEPAWKTYTVPGPGEPGNDTWSGDTWKRGGASVWLTGTYDPELNLTYWGTGNASPWFGDQRAGDNLYTASTVAIEPDTGKMTGHFQYQWNESWDWDEPDAPLVLDYQKDGAGQWWTGVDIPDIGFAVDKSAKYFGQIQAWDINAGKRAWSHQFPDSMNWGGIVTTAGGLVFAGGTNDRNFRAFDAGTGKVLWQFTTNSGIVAPPMSFAVDGTQYVGVVSGWGVDPEFQQGLLTNLLGWPKDIPTGGVVWVFAVSQ